MSQPSALTLKVFLAVIVNDLVDGLAQVLMKKGLAGAPSFSSGFHEILSFVMHHAVSPLVLCGILIYAFNFFLWILILSKLDLSLAVPLGSTAYVLIPVLAVVFLHEKVTVLEILGLGLILIGIQCLSKSKSPALQAPPLL